MLDGVDDEDVAVVEVAPVDGRQLSDDRLPLALHDEQLRVLLVADHVQAGRNPAVKDPAVAITVNFRTTIANELK